MVGTGMFLIGPAEASGRGSAHAPWTQQDTTFAGLVYDWFHVYKRYAGTRTGIDDIDMTIPRLLREGRGCSPSLYSTSTTQTC